MARANESYPRWHEPTPLTQIRYIPDGVATTGVMAYMNLRHIKSYTTALITGDPRVRVPIIVTNDQARPVLPPTKAVWLVVFETDRQVSKFNFPIIRCLIYSIKITVSIQTSLGRLPRFNLCFMYRVYWIYSMSSVLLCLRTKVIS